MKTIIATAALALSFAAPAAGWAHRQRNIHRRQCRHRSENRSDKRVACREHRDFRPRS